MQLFYFCVGNVRYPLCDVFSGKILIYEDGGKME